MHRIIDLHTHSTASDGSMSPAELVRHAKASGLAAIALTDHDTVDGIEEAIEEGENIGIEVLPGIEIGVDFRREMHILGYFKDKNYMNIADKISFLKKNREERNNKTIEKLNEMGFYITIDDVQKKAKGNIVGRPHIAEAMVEKGYAGSITDAFTRYLAYGKPAYFKKEKLTPCEGIEEITRAGGIPVLAHPILLQFPIQELDSLLYELVSYGLKGIEAYYVENTDSFTDKTIELAKKHNLIITGGTDFHGTFKPDIKIGTGYGNLMVPYELLVKLRKALNGT
ncbi:MAG: PHP domain-containing protein [Firmicutes bacterium]|nr:PHP domain-containing protein [Bacillota bacterium]